MLLRELLCDVDYAVEQGTDLIEINQLCNHTRSIKEGSVFVCIRGANCDGHNLIRVAVELGAIAVVVEEDVVVDAGITVIRVADTRYVLARMAAVYYGYPARSLVTIGITGTKGKTSVTYMVGQILEDAGYKVGIIGTIEIVIGDRVIPAKNTTPESIEIQKYLSEMVKEGCQYVVMEVSSQGLMLHRTVGMMYDIAAFTNLGDDHIGGNEHPDFQSYMECKSRLFRQCKIGIGNFDDAYYENVFEYATCEKITVGVEKLADYKANNIELLQEMGVIGVSYEIEGEEKIQVPMLGRYSVYNSLVAFAICRQLGVSLGIIKNTLSEVKVPGRNEMIVVRKGVVWMIDYAHNAMSLESLLLTIRGYQPKRIVCIFGCGGNRSKVRRYEMGEVAGNLADFTILTSDNPRYEEPQKIIDDIRVGMKKTTGDYIEIVDRREAIRYAISNGKEGDFVVLAGKGHETYQEIRGVKYPMDDRVLIEDEKRLLCLQT